MSNIAGLSEMVIYESQDGGIKLSVSFDGDTVWLTQAQIAELFGTKTQAITKHIQNIYEDQELDESPTCSKMEQVRTEGSRQVKRTVNVYNLDMILSVGYRVNSKQATHFRSWATDVLRRYIIEGHVENERRLQQLSQAVVLLERVSDALDTNQVIEVVKSYASALDLLDDYDHQRIAKPDGTDAIYVLDYDECIELIKTLRFNDESSLFGVEKDDSFKSSIAAIYQSFGGKEIYLSVQEKAANLLYFIVKNHSFHDGNKRIAATIFLYFLDRNGMLYREGKKVISDSALVATTIMIAESKPEEKEIMTSLVMNFLA